MLSLLRILEHDPSLIIEIGGTKHEIDRLVAPREVNGGLFGSCSCELNGIEYIVAHRISKTSVQAYIADDDDLRLRARILQSVAESS